MSPQPPPDCKHCGHPFLEHWMGHAPCSIACIDTCRIADFTGRTDQGDQHTAECCKCPCYEAPAQ